MKTKKKVNIVEIDKISKRDAYYEDRKKLVGLKGKFKIHYAWETKWKSGTFTFLKPVEIEGEKMKAILFYEVKVK